MPSKMKVVFMPRREDREKFLEYQSNFEKLDRAGLIAAYNEAWKVGLVGNHMQSINYFALHTVFEKVFGKSPITLEDDVILGLTERICEDGETWRYE